MDKCVVCDHAKIYHRRGPDDACDWDGDGCRCLGFSTDHERGLPDAAVKRWDAAHG